MQAYADIYVTTVAAVGQFMPKVTPLMQAVVQLLPTGLKTTLYHVLLTT